MRSRVPGTPEGKPHIQRYRGRWCCMPVRNVPFPCEFGADLFEAFARFSARWGIIVAYTQ